jgi:hypothetical protein
MEIQKQKQRPIPPKEQDRRIWGRRRRVDLGEVLPIPQLLTQTPEQRPIPQFPQKTLPR